MKTKVSNLQGHDTKTMAKSPRHDHRLMSTPTFCEVDKGRFTEVTKVVKTEGYCEAQATPSGFGGTARCEQGLRPSLLASITWGSELG